jgi:hypothetical protein
MRRLVYFFEKFFNAVFHIHPLSFIFLMVVTFLIYLLARKFVNEDLSVKKHTALFAFGITVFIGLPIVGLILYLIIMVVLLDQPF